ETDKSDDFSREEAQHYLGTAEALELDRAEWEPILVELSRRIDIKPITIRSAVELRGHNRVQYVVNSEGTRIREHKTWIRLSMWASTIADDGMKLSLYRWEDVHDPKKLPGPEELEEWADNIANDLAELHDSPRGEPYSGPILLRGRAAGVFIHEVLGHRMEGHRQKDEDEGQTFKDYVGKAILPETISVFDDPTLETYAGFDLNGHYRFDEEGQPAQRAMLVDNGILRGFLMSRSPIEGFANSNGHGRAAAQSRPVARMANTILETTDPKSFDQLKAMLKKELGTQDREYGLLIDEIGGGFTLTGRVYPNAINLRATTAWRIYRDGRADELIRGIDLVGTPLVALGSIVAAGNDPGVFNGFCGAESGSIPNSAVSPSLLLRQLEIQRKEKGQDRPPLLPRPDQLPGEDS
ncbi:MAG: TldD/PmbA family protein, partial [Proteobacteria bacterium]|nr:TldD/PmbA family protein [Pseudomonadota bacterium]